MRITAQQLATYVESRPFEEAPSPVTTHSQSCCGVRELSGLSRIGRSFPILDPKHPSNYIQSDPVTSADILKGIIWNIWVGTYGVEIPVHESGSPIVRLISCAHIFYNQALSPTRPPGTIEYGEAFTSFILENKLGTVHRMPMVINPNSGNELITYIWTHDHDALNAWYRENKDK